MAELLVPIIGRLLQRTLVMANDIHPRHVQTRVKHTILKDYLSAWGGIILTGRRNARMRKRMDTIHLHLVYVDCFAFSGRYDGEIEEVERGVPRSKVPGSPIIGIQALEGLRPMAQQYGVSLRTNYILVEKKRSNYVELLDSLRAFGCNTFAENPDSLGGLGDGDVAVLEADALTLHDRLTAYTSRRGTIAFYLLDPYGPIPLDFVGDVIRQPNTDAMIYMPYDALNRRLGLARKSSLTMAQSRLLAHYDRMFGNDGWRQIASELASTPVSSQQAFDSLEMELVNLYKFRLKTKDQALLVKSIPLRFEDKDRTFYHIYLTTHNVDGALAMNQVLYDAGYQEQVLRWKLREARLEAERAEDGAEQLPLFPVEPSPPQNPTKVPRESVEQIAENVNQVLRSYKGNTLTFRQVCENLVDEPYFRGEIEAALKRLNACDPRRVAFTSAPRLANDIPIRVL